MWPPDPVQSPAHGLALTPPQEADSRGPLSHLALAGIAIFEALPAVGLCHSWKAALSSYFHIVWLPQRQWERAEAGEEKSAFYD